MAAKVADHDKLAVRDLTEAAIAGGATAAALKELRADLAATLGVSPPSVRAVSAYVEYSATEALADTGLAGIISNEQLVCAARLVRGSQSWAEDVASLAADLNISPADLERAVTTYEEYYQSRPGTDARAAGAGTPHEPHAPDQSDGANDATVALSAEPSPATPHDPQLEPGVESSLACDSGAAGLNVSGPVIDRAGHILDDSALSVLSDTDLDLDEESGSRGDTANYDFPAKHEWRDFWDAFIRGHFGPARLQDVKVICLPGRKVEPEVSRYLKMGVRPENIFCVEGSTRVRAEFLENCRRLGVRAFPMKLEAALKRLAAEGVEFDIANYDFHGQHCEGHAKALYATPLAQDAIVIYNAMGKRENRETQEYFDHAAKDLRRNNADIPVLEAVPAHRREVAGRLTRYLAVSDRLFDELDGHAGLEGYRRVVVPTRIRDVAGAGHEPLRRDLLLDVADGFFLNYSRADMAGFPTEAVRAFVLEHASQAYRRTAPIVSSLLVERLNTSYSDKLFRGCEPLPLGLVVWHTAVSQSYMHRRAQTSSYRSRQSEDAVPAPFHTAAFRLRRADAVLAEHDHAVRFCSALIREALLSKRDRGGDTAQAVSRLLEVRDGAGRVVPKGRPLEWNHTIRAVRDGEARAEIKAADLRHAMLAAAAVERKEGFDL